MQYVYKYTCYMAYRNVPHDIEFTLNHLKDINTLIQYMCIIFELFRNVPCFSSFSVYSFCLNSTIANLNI